jgi:hypothetical protein
VLLDSRGGGDERRPKAAAAYTQRAILWASYELRQRTTLILTHRFEKAGSVAAGGDDGGGANSSHQSAAKAFTGIVNPGLWGCLKDTSVASKHIAHPRCSEQRIDETRRYPISLVK